MQTEENAAGRRPGVAQRAKVGGRGTRVTGMHPRAITGDQVPALLAEVLDGGRPIAVLAGAAPSAWRLDEPLEAGAAVLIGTSGSTGDPKGVLLTADAIRASAAATHDRLGGPGTWVCPLPMHYVAGLMTAARAAVAGTEVLVAPSDLSLLPAPDGRSYLSLVAAQLHRALEQPAITSALALFDAVLVGGSAIPAGLLRRGRDAGITLVATYGMAETCGGCVYDGVPLGGVRLDFDPGERILITAPQVFAGYRFDPVATAAALDGRTLRTQDRGRWRDGRLQVLGRVDDVVVTGGINVDLAQAQRACDEAFGPSTVGLLGVPDERWGVRIVALSAADLPLDELRDRLARSLQPVAVPREVRRVAGLPRTSTGKIDRQGLRRMWAEGS